ncbi:hypothetical protein HCJ29_01355 [Listeria seeligeri]|nr:hypothetical protein [Listeria seeligeri]
MRTHDIMQFTNQFYEVKYAENSRETFRKQALHPFRTAALIEDNGKATNSPNYRYRLTEESLKLIQQFKSEAWAESLKTFLTNHTSLIEIYASKKKMTKMEVKINNKNRGSYGKGYRSLIVSIFYASMVLFCEEKDLPYSSFIVLDSPINAFKDTKNRELLSNSTKNKFFNFLYEHFENKQVIIFENDTINMDDELYNKVNITPFTRNNTGRYGFFPHYTNK